MDSAPRNDLSWSRCRFRPQACPWDTVPNEWGVQTDRPFLSSKCRVNAEYMVKVLDRRVQVCAGFMSDHDGARLLLWYSPSRPRLSLPDPGRSDCKWSVSNPACRAGYLHKTCGGLQVAKEESARILTGDAGSLALMVLVADLV